MARGGVAQTGAGVSVLYLLSRNEWVPNEGGAAAAGGCAGSLVRREAGAGLI